MARVRWDCVDRATSSCFRRLGKLIGKSPGYFVIVPLLVAGLLSTGVQRIIYEEDPEYLFSPENGRSKADRNVIDNLFPFNNSDFDIGRMTQLGRFGRVILRPKDEGTILRRQIFQDIVDLDAIIHNITIEWDKKLWSYEDLCAHSERRCFENEILDYAELIDEISNRTYMLQYPLMRDPATQRTVFFAAYLGGVVTDELGFVESAAAMNLMYYMDTSTPIHKERAALWEKAFLDAMEEAADFRHIVVTRFVSNTLQTELERNNQSVLPFFSITMIIMLGFSVITCLMNDWVKSRPWLGVLGCISSVFAVSGSFGLVMYCGLPFIGINLAAPFLMLGIGMDDTFVLLAAWRRTNPKDPVPDRLGNAYADAAVSITITSLTNFLSFLIGAITPFPCVRIFCLYTALAVLFTYIYHITFFGGCMAISGFAEKRNLHSVICVPVTPRSLSATKSCCYRVFCAGGINPDDPDNPKDRTEPFMMSFFKNTIGGILSVWPIKIFIIMMFLGYLAVGIWGCTLLREGLERRRLSRSDSYSIKFYDLEDSYFRKYPYRIQVVVNETMNYADPLVQKRIETMLTMIESTKYIGEARLTESWLREYMSFLQDPRVSSALNGFNMSKEEDFIKGLRGVFLKHPAATFFHKDILFSEDGTAIKASRFVVQAVNVTDTNQEKEMVLELRNIADRFPFPVALFHVYFIFFDQFLLVRETSIQAISVAAAVMMIISLIFIPSASCAVWVAFSIVSIEIGVIGYMTLWNVNLDTISMINLIMCIGFSVDFSAHISYAYITSPGKNAEERLKGALHSLGMPIFQGSMSTILGIIALGFAPSYIFLTFFKTVFLVILFGALHGILLLPVLLSISDSCFGGKKSDKRVKEPRQKTPQQQPFFVSKDGNTIVTANGRTPIFIPRPLYTNDSGRSERLRSINGGVVGNGEAAVAVIENWRDQDAGLGTSAEGSSDGSWKLASEADELHRSKRSPDKAQEQHVNPGFVPDEELENQIAPPSRHSSSSSTKSRIASYHEGVILGMEPRSAPRSRDSSRRESPLTTHMTRINSTGSGYVREFNRPL